MGHCAAKYIYPRCGREVKVKTNAYRMGTVKRLISWLLVGAVVLAIGLPINDYVHRQILPFGINMPPLDAS